MKDFLENCIWYRGYIKEVMLKDVRMRCYKWMELLKGVLKANYLCNYYKMVAC